MRYKNVETKTDPKTGQNYYATKIPQYVEKTNNDIYVITEQGDRLDTIADQFYGDPLLWYRIADANNLSLINVPSGVRLRIPPKE